MKHRRLGLGSLALLAMSSVVGAQGVPAPAAAQAPAPYMRVSCASLDAADKLIADLQLPFPSLKLLLAGGHPFLHPDALATDRPFGMVLIANDAYPVQGNPAVVAALPIVDGKVTADSLATAGARPVPGKADQFRTAAHGIRLMPGQILVQSGMNIALPFVGDKPFAGDYLRPETLAHVSLDLAAVRRIAPAQWRQSLLEIRRATSRPTEPAPAEAVLESLDAMTFSLAADGKTLRIRSTVTPFEAVAVKPVPRPAFPRGVIGVTHVVCPNGLTDFWTQLVNAGEGLNWSTASGETMTPAQQAHAKQAVQRGLRLFTGGGATSVGVAVRDGKPIFYVVSQLSPGTDGIAASKALRDAFVVLRKDLGFIADAPVPATTYSASGMTVHRAVSPPMNGATHYIDTVQSGQTLYVAFSAHEGRFVEELVAAGTDGTSSVFCAGYVDLPALFAAIQPMTGLPRELLARVTTQLANERVTWSLECADRTLVTEVQMSLPALRQIVQLATGDAAPAPVQP